LAAWSPAFSGWPPHVRRKAKAWAMSWKPWLSRQIHRESIYTAELKRKGIGWEVTLDGRRITSDPGQAR
jgi:hypothetical protein